MSTDHAPDREAVLGQLQRILDSTDFDASDRNKRFLAYIVGKALDGEVERIKAFTIATSVFGRDTEFDAQTDPIVRIEASRLRRALERYYLTSGLSDPIRITIPKGSYVPTFEVREHSAAPGDQATLGGGAPSVPKWLLRIITRPRLAAAGLAGIAATVLAVLVGMWSGDWVASKDAPTLASARHTGPTILVMPFADENYDKRHPELARAFTREIIAGLTRFKELSVHSERLPRGRTNEADLHLPVDSLGVSFIVSGGVSVSADRVRVLASLSDAKTGKYLWSEGFEDALTPTEIFKIQREIGKRIVQVLAQRYGVIFSEVVKDIRGRPPQSLTSYECVLGFYHHYWRRATAEHFTPTRECLERAVREEPTYAEALSSLALMYIDAHRAQMDRGSLQFEPLPRALELAKRAIDLAPQAAHGHRALYLTYWMMNDVPRSLEVGEQALTLNPNDTEVMADVAARLCLAGRWDRGLPLLRMAFARNPELPDQYRYPLFLRRFIDRDYEAALVEAQKINLQDVVYTHVALAVSYAGLGRSADAAKAVGHILEVYPSYGDQVHEDLRRRNIYPEAIAALIEGLRGAGLRVKPVS